nr:unnamed protein product [Spirometra erinaceieuropaei]
MFTPPLSFASVYDGVTQLFEEFSLATHTKDHKPSHSTSGLPEFPGAPPCSAATLVAATSPTNPFVDPPFPHPNPVAPPTDRLYTSAPSPLLAPDAYEPGHNIRDWLRDLDLFLTDVPPHQHTCFLLRFLCPSARRRAFDAGLTPATPFPVACRCVVQLFDTPDAPGIAAEQFAKLRQAPGNLLTTLRLNSPDLPPRLSPIYHTPIGTTLSSTVSFQASSIARSPTPFSSTPRVLCTTPCGSAVCILDITEPTNPLRDPLYPQPDRSPKPQIDGALCRSDSLITTLAASTARLSNHEFATAAITHLLSPPPLTLFTFTIFFLSLLLLCRYVWIVTPLGLGPVAHEQLKTLLNAFPDLFAWSTDTIGRTHLIQHTIDTGDAKPVWQPPRRIPLHYREEVNKLLDELLQAKIIQPSSSPWASPIALVPKNDGSVRLCVDYRRLNAVTVRDSFPLPRLDDTLDALGNAAWFSTLDLKSGYWQVEIHPDDRHKTAFTVPQGLYEVQTLPFGLCNAAATFQRLMYRVLQPLIPDKCLVYLDDIIVFGRSIDEHNHKLRAVLEALRSAGLTLNPTKCLFLRPYERPEAITFNLRPPRVSRSPSLLGRYRGARM